MQINSSNLISNTTNYFTTHQEIRGTMKFAGNQYTLSWEKKDSDGNFTAAKENVGKFYNKIESILHDNSSNSGSISDLSTDEHSVSNNSFNREIEDTISSDSNSNIHALNYNNESFKTLSDVKERAAVLADNTNKNKPRPNEYLGKKTLDLHKAQFENGGGWLAPKWALDKFGREKLGRADGQFIMTGDELNQVLVETQGNIQEIEKKLGIPCGAWDKVMVKIEVNKESLQKTNLRMPSGNEAGANEHWLPGGKLPSGRTEGVIDAVPKGDYREVSLRDAMNELEGQIQNQTTLGQSTRGWYSQHAGHTLSSLQKTKS